MRVVMALIVLALLALLVASGWYVYSIWTEFGPTDVPGWMIAAMVGGVVFSLIIGCGLMALMFYSSREGYDDRASGGDPNR
jgi:hypothetical protein